MDKWILLDHRVQKRQIELTSEEFIKSLNHGLIFRSDLVCPPAQNQFMPVFQCKDLFPMLSEAEWNEKLILSNKNLEFYCNLPVNPKTAFAQENYFFSYHFKNRKLTHLDICAPLLHRILWDQEVIYYLFYCQSKQKDKFSDSIVILSDQRVINLIWNLRKKEVQDIKSISLKYIQGYEFQKENSDFYFSLVLKNENQFLFHLANITQTDWVQLSSLFSALFPTERVVPAFSQENWSQNTCSFCHSLLSDKSFLCPHCDSGQIPSPMFLPCPRIIKNIFNFLFLILKKSMEALATNWLIQEMILFFLFFLLLLIYGPEPRGRIAFLFLCTVLLIIIHRKNNVPKTVVN